MIVQVGPYPKPIGGISVYIKRMKHYLDLQGINNEVWDISGIKKYENGVRQIRLRYIPIMLILKKDIEIIHYNLCGIMPKIYISIFNKILLSKKKKIITLHGDNADIIKKSKRVFIMTLNTFDCIICVKAGDSKKLKNEGVKKPIYDLPAFIVPTQSTDIELPQYIQNFIKQKNFIISANASSIQFNNSIDLYGIDMCIDLAAALKNKGFKIGMIFCLPYINNDFYYKELICRINENGIQQDFLFVHENMELWPIIEKSQIFIRPTCDDGYGVSLAEAIYYNVPAIASDVCERPEGTIIFTSRDIKDLYKKTIDIINNYDNYKEKIRNIKIQDSTQKLFEIYKRILRYKS
ncbi:glycosyltransferase [Candidatus Clostridium stratigraminis]|uniref:Glycosyltransferase n=1 Tax=Candidatus Clostridium stratigraminis TaxID=3381661 RepID=A0ABW8T324_9CLOT